MGVHNQIEPDVIQLTGYSPHWWKWLGWHLSDDLNMVTLDMRLYQRQNAINGFDNINPLWWRFWIIRTRNCQQTVRYTCRTFSRAINRLQRAIVARIRLFVQQHQF